MRPLLALLGAVLSLCSACARDTEPHGVDCSQCHTAHAPQTPILVTGDWGRCIVQDRGGLLEDADYRCEDTLAAMHVRCLGDLPCIIEDASGELETWRNIFTSDRPDARWSRIVTPQAEGTLQLETTLTEQDSGRSYRQNDAVQIISPSRYALRCQRIGPELPPALPCYQIVAARSKRYATMGLKLYAYRGETAITTYPSVEASPVLENHPDHAVHIRPNHNLDAAILNSQPGDYARIPSTDIDIDIPPDLVGSGQAAWLVVRHGSWSERLSWSL